MNIFNNGTLHWRILIVVMSSLLLAVGARFFFIPFLFQVQEDFHYEANVLSLDNFFNESTGMFLGEERSVTTFGYQASTKENGVIPVENFFHVRTLSGDKIISISREYSINAMTQEHVLGIGAQDREGYLFAPRHLKKNTSFSYWHINYNLPIQLTFEKEELIAGLKTFRYSASFGVDQTKDLTHLPGVPESRGINLDVSLKVWIEPVSGWLVKYEDDAVAYYYDVESNQRLNPWNKFSNRYRQESIIDQVGHAKKLKAGIIFLELLFPLWILLLLVGISLFKEKRELGWVFILFGTIVTVGVYLFLVLYTPKQEPEYLIGISYWVSENNLVYQENVQGFKDALASAGYHEGQNIIFLEKRASRDISKQKNIANEFLEKNVDIVYSLTTPGTSLLKDLIPNRPIVFSIVTYPVQSGLIKSLQSSGNNLVGSRNWVPVSRQLSVFREIVPTISNIGFARSRNELNSEVQLKEMQKATQPFNISVVDLASSNVEELQQKLVNSLGEVDAIYSACDTLIQGEAEKMITDFALREKIPVLSCNASGVFGGDLLAVAADFYKIGQLAGEKAVLILEGATPNSLGTNTVARPFIYINAETAELLDLIIPQDILTQAKEIIR